MPNRRQITEEISQAYEQYFNMPVTQNMNWAPKIICPSCRVGLAMWVNGKRSTMPFGIPMIWSDPGDHCEDNCYVCANIETGINRFKRRKIDYKGVQSAQLPLVHSSTVPVPRRPSISEAYIPQTFQSIPESSVSLYQPSEVTVSCNHIEITQTRLNMMVRQLKLSQRQGTLLVQHLKAVNILAPDVKVTGFRKRQEGLKQFFKVSNNNTFAHCDNIPGLMESMNVAYNPKEWRLFIDSSKRTLKAVLLHIDNAKNSVPVAVSTDTKETYNSMKLILEAVKYNEHQWKICADLKVITILSGLQCGYTKNMCFLCLWNSRYKGNQYAKKDWMLREHFELHQANVINIPLVPKEKILLPPLHIKLGIVKNFIKALNPEGRAFQRLQQVFPRLSAAKIKEGLLVKLNESNRILNTLFSINRCSQWA